MSNDSDDSDDPDVMPFWVIILAVVLILTFMIGCLVCFTVRCFAPEQTYGPQWITTSDGNPQYVKSAVRGGRWVQTFTRDDTQKPDKFGELSIYQKENCQGNP